MTSDVEMVGGMEVVIEEVAVGFVVVSQACNFGPSALCRVIGGWFRARGSAVLAAWEVVSLFAWDVVAWLGDSANVPKLSRFPPKSSSSSDDRSESVDNTEALRVLGWTPFSIVPLPLVSGALFICES